MALLAKKVFVALKRLANCTAVCSLGPATGAALMFFVEGVVLLLISDFFSTAMIDLFLALKSNFDNAYDRLYGNQCAKRLSPVGDCVKRLKTLGVRSL